MERPESRLIASISAAVVKGKGTQSFRSGPFAVPAPISASLSTKPPPIE